ncbi:hypothetical protein STXM2123_2509 [Streptomyces sp. F-3]|nr:hypothetical protein STXM2123_2509 [Streptomyces sp. F-3]
MRDTGRWPAGDHRCRPGLPVDRVCRGRPGVRKAGTATARFRP